MGRYVCLFDVRWKDKKGESVMSFLFLEILVRMRYDAVDVYVRPLRMSRTYKCSVNGEKELDSFILSNVVEDISKELRKKFWMALEDEVFETLSVGLIYFNKDDFQEKEEEVDIIHNKKERRC